MKKFSHRVLPFVFVIALCLSAVMPAAAAALCADADGDGEITLNDVFCVLADPSAKSDPAGATAAALRILRASVTDAPECGVFYENDFSDPKTLADFTAYRGKWSIRGGRLWLDSMDDDSVESSAFLLYSGAETMHLKNYRIDVRCDCPLRRRVHPFRRAVQRFPRLLRLCWHRREQGRDRLRKCRQRLGREYQYG